MRISVECIASPLLDFASLGCSPVAVPPIQTWFFREVPPSLLSCF